jgi:hypothetical protein
LRRHDVKRYGPLAILMAVVPLLAFGPNERIAPTHWALIVGVGDYIHFGDEPGGDLPVDRALSILQMEADEGALDQDAVDLFVESKVYDKVLNTD